MAIDVSGDLAYFDGLTTVTVTQAGTATEQEVDNALPRQVSLKEAEASNGVYTISDVKFNLDIADTDYEPKPGDTITDDSKLWVVLAVDTATLETRYRCWCKLVDFNSNISETVTIKRSTWKKGSHGAVSATLTTVASGVETIVQDMQKKLMVKGDKRDVEVSHKLFFPQGTDIEPGDTIIDSSDNQYKVNAVSKLSKLDSYVVVDAVTSIAPLEGG